MGRDRQQDRQGTSYYSDCDLQNPNKQGADLDHPSRAKTLNMEGGWLLQREAPRSCQPLLAPLAAVPAPD